MKPHNKEALDTAIWILLCIGICLLLHGCGATRPLIAAPTQPSGVGASIAAIGQDFLTIGGWGLGLAIIAQVIAMWAGFGFISIIRYVISACAASLVCGAAFVWLSDNLWVMWLSCGIAALALAWYHRDDLQRWYLSGKALVQKLKR